MPVGHDISNQVRYVVLTGIQQNKLLHFSNYWIANPLQHNAEGYQVMFGNSVVKGSMRLSDLETQGVVDRLSYIIQSPRIIHEPVTGEVHEFKLIPVRRAFPMDRPLA